jgi:hypothetical protein
VYLAGVLQAPNGAAELITPIRPIKQGNLKQQPPSNKKRAFQVVVDDEIELEEGQIRAQMVCWSCQLQLCAGP